MNRRGAFAAFLAHLVGIAYLGEITGNASLALGLAAGHGAALVLPPIRVGVIAQAFVVGVSLVSGFTLALFLPARSLPGSPPLEIIPYGLATSSLILTGVRGAFINPVGGVRLSVAVGTLVLLGCGAVPGGVPFALTCVAYTLLGLIALHRADPHRPPFLELTPRHHVVAAVIFVLASSVGLLLARVLPPLYDRSHDWLSRWTEEHEIGFGQGTITLGSLSGLRGSNRIVMRVRGPAPPLMRGAAYSRYARGRWNREPDEWRPREFGDSLEGDWTEIFYTRSSTRYFLPLEVEEIQAWPPRIRLNEFGLLRAGPGGTPKSLRFRAGKRDARLRPRPPGDGDVRIYAAVRGTLEQIAEEWVGDETDPRRQVDAIVARLERDYTYSTHYTRRPRRDYVLQFLLENPVGHCEYFASATALLCRALGIPARLITGYFVSEYNPVGGYSIVRERDAHAWVEVHLPEHGWVSVNPVPQRTQVLSHRELGPVAAWLEFIWFAGREIRVWLVIVVLVLTLVGIAWQRRARRRSRSRVAELPPFAAPSPRLLELLARLETQGHGRRRGETLHRYARRLRARARHPELEGVERLAETARVIALYAAQRYDPSASPGDEVEERLRVVISGR